MTIAMSINCKKVTRQTENARLGFVSDACENEMLLIDESEWRPLAMEIGGGFKGLVPKT